MEKLQDYIFNVSIVLTVVIFSLGYGTVNSTPKAQILFTRFDLMINRALNAWSEDIPLRTPVASPAQQTWSQFSAQNDLAERLHYFQPSWQRGYLITSGAIILSLLALLTSGFWFMKIGAGFVDRKKHYVVSQSN